MGEGGGGRGVERQKKRVIKTHISVFINPHPQPDSHSRQAHGTGVLCQGCAGIGINKGKSLLASHTKDNHTCVDT